MLKKILILTIITLSSTLMLHAEPSHTSEPIDVTSLHEIVYEYDKLNRVTKATYTSGESIEYSYDAGGNLLGVVFDDPNVMEKPNLALHKDILWDSLFVVNPNKPINNQPYHEEQVYLNESISYGVQYTNDSRVDINTGNEQITFAVIYLDGSSYSINSHEFGKDTTFRAGLGGWLSDSISYKIHSAGKHTLKIVLDPDNKIDESNENDNVLVATFYVMNRDGDSDNDGIKDVNEGTIDTDGDGIVNFLDTDSDNDGMSDKDEHQYGLNPLDASDATLDSDGDGVSNADEIALGTNISVNEASISIKPLEDIITIVNANMTPITIEANASNGSPVVLSVDSNDTDVAVAILDSNMLTLTVIEDAQGVVEISVTATLGDKSIKENFILTIKEKLDNDDEETINDSETNNENDKKSGGGALGYVLPLFILLMMLLGRRNPV